LANNFPPIPVYPLDYDSNRTLYVVYNTSESVTVTANSAWANEIEIKPVDANSAEIWATNGFANIGGELFYYDDVEKNGSNKIYKFIKCARNLGGTHTRNNPAGTEVRGFVIAEHHNQIVNSILKMQDFFGERFSTDTNTLDYRIRNLAALPVIFDDYTCPDVSFNFYIISDDPATGILAQYDITIDGTYTVYRLDFGDGEFTTTSTNGQHRYAPNATIDPVLTLSNNKCTLVQSPITRNLVTEPAQIAPETPFEIKLPTIPNLPPLIIPNIPVPSAVITIPPIVFPCLDIGPIGPINIPSVIQVIPPIDIPSVITIIGPEIPSVITVNDDIPPVINVVDDIPTVITIVDDIPDVITIIDDIPTIITIVDDIPDVITIVDDIPDVITVIDDIPDVITIIDDIPTIITIVDDIPDVITVIDDIPDTINVNFEVPPLGPVYFVPIQLGPVYFVPIQLGPVYFNPIQLGPVYFNPVQLGPVYFAEPPQIPVYWGTPPTVSCVVTVECPSASPVATSFKTNSLGLNYNDEFFDPVEINIGEVGIPSEIKLKVPEIPDIRVIHDIPALIRVESPIIPDIKLVVPDNFPSEIKIVADNIPTSIELKADNLPKAIKLDASDLPSFIKLSLPDEMPTIKLDTSGIPSQIQVVGIPSTIELIGAPSEIKLVLPEKPEIELVYKGAPIDVKINLDINRLTGDDGTQNCVAIVPCNPKG
jgi:PKD repeat protein